MLFRNWVIGFAASILYIVKDYVPKEGFKQKKKIKLHKDLIGIHESMRPKDSNSLNYMKQKQTNDIKPFNF